MRFGDIKSPEPFDERSLLKVHAANYITYLKTAWKEWNALGRSHDVLPFAFPVPGMRAVEPQQIDGKAGFYSFDTGAPISKDTWVAVRGSAACALTAQAVISRGEKSAFALCRPPGHHAGIRTAGGYCYVNNAALAAQAFLDSGASRVAILDIDYHHGNGTQEIFYNRADVLFVSIHADPAYEFPYFLGRADEVGIEDGAGFNLNFPLPKGTSFYEWGRALRTACGKVSEYNPDVLVVSLGVDTFERDPISHFKLRTDDYLSIGEIISRLRLPTLFVMEGGYALAEFGTNVVNTLQGFQDA
jgi:acetoin utilization deacetylase AcuC-like enzyme